ncbi:MAG: LysM peptidoglycan-binding domain-containing protein [Dehalococcoidia bacterium]
MEYVVRPGDSLWSISRRMYGDGNVWSSLFSANMNQIFNPNLIYPGMVIKLP